MSVTNIVRAVVKPGSNYTVTKPIMKEHRGQILLIEGLDLPEVYEIDFSNDRHHGSSVTMVGNADGVLIPTQFIKTGQDVYAFYYYVGDNFGQTEHVFKIPNDFRPDRTDDVPEPEQDSKIDQAIAALNEAVVKTEENKTAAKNSADSAYEDANRAEQARDAAEGHSRDAGNAANQADTSERNAKGYSEAAGRSADAAAESERNAANSAAEAGRKADEITGLTVEAETLTPGSEATADYQNGQLILGIPRGDKGEKGDTGATGPRGPQGIQGEKGETGDTGPKGDKGDQGIQGIQGPKGDKGDKGDTGPQGVKGDTGDTGPKGDKGDQGIQGIQGPKGDKGDKGDTGPQGVKGDKGDAGEQGPQGEKGDKGDKGDTGEVSLTDLNTALMDKADIITDTASGSIASFPDGADNLPLKSLVIDINPIQDLHGQDSPYPAGGGKNKLHVTAQSTTINGVTFTINNDGTVTANGTATQNATLIVGTYIGEGVSVIASGCPSGGNRTDKYRIFNTYIGSDEGNGTSAAAPDVGKSCTVTLYVYAGYTAVNLVFKPMIRLATETDATFTPYSNICPISGWTEIDINHSDADMTNPTTITIDLGQTVYGGKLDVLSGGLVVDRVHKTYNGTEIWNTSNSSDPVYYALWNQDKSIGNQDMTQIADWLVAGGNDYQRWGAYRVQTNGAIVVGNLINKVSGNYKFADASELKAYLAEHPLTVCYKIATPITIQLTPNQVNSLLGVNNLWADSGDTEVEYRANTKLYIAKKIAEAISALS